MVYKGENNIVKKLRRRRNMVGKYILEGKTPKPILDLIEWGKWFEKADRHVANTLFPNGVRISTVFLGLDHSSGNGAPLLFETMIFGGEHDAYQERYSTYQEAELGHTRIVEMVKSDIE